MNSFQQKTTGILTILLVAVTLGVSYYTHVKAEYNFPQPWRDESILLWQSKAIQERNSLFAPEADPERTVMWMPPGYFVVTGVIFKAIGFSLVKARWISWFFSVVAYSALLVFFADRKHRFLYWGIISLVFLDSFFVVMGNVARMEALVMAIVLWGFVMLKHDKPWYGLALLAASLLVHPNGGYFALGGGVWFVWKYRLKWPRPSAGEVFVGLVVCGLYAGYLLHVAQNWSWFLSDMRVQFVEKGSNDILGSFLMPKYLIVTAAFAVFSIAAIVFQPVLMLQLILGYASIVVRLVGNEQWYVVFVPLGLLIIILTILDYTTFVVDKVGGRIRQRTGNLITIGVAAVCIFGAVKGSVIERLSGYPERMRWAGMVFADPVPYLLPEDVAALTPLIYKKLFTGKINTVHFSPRADSLFFLEAAKDRFLITDPALCPLKADILVIHTFPSYDKDWSDGNEKNRSSFNASDDSLVYSRNDGAAKWYIKYMDPK